jgi:hypothetical protein
VDRPEGNRVLERFRRRSEYNIKMELTEIGWGGMGWINLAPDGCQRRAVVNTAVNLRVA